jgi:hypothetical protein
VTQVRFAVFVPDVNLNADWDFLAVEMGVKRKLWADGVIG